MEKTFTTCFAKLQNTLEHAVLLSITADDSKINFEFLTADNAKEIYKVKNALAEISEFIWCKDTCIELKTRPYKDESTREYNI